MITYQVQKSRDGRTWIPMQPAEERHRLGDHGMVEGGDHWFTDHHEAWVSANMLRNRLTWSEVRMVHRDADGTLIHEQTIL